jgi:hypothetical protein
MVISDLVSKTSLAGKVGIAGKIHAGAVCVGACVRILPSNVVATVKAIEAQGVAVPVATASAAVEVGLVGLEEEDVRVGSCMCQPDFPVLCSRRLRVGRPFSCLHASIDDLLGENIPHLSGCSLDGTPSLQRHLWICRTNAECTLALFAPSAIRAPSAVALLPVSTMLALLVLIHTCSQGVCAPPSTPYVRFDGCNDRLCLQVRILVVHVPRPLIPGQSAVLHMHATASTCRIRALVALLNLKTGAIVKGGPAFRVLLKDQAAIVDLDIDEEVCVECVEGQSCLSRLVLRMGGAMVASGTVLAVLDAPQAC